MNHHSKPQPTLAELKSQWRERFWASYREHLPLATVVTVATTVGMLFWLPSFIGHEATAWLCSLALVQLPLLPMGPAAVTQGPYPNEETYELNRQLREAYVTVRASRPSDDNQRH